MTEIHNREAGQCYVAAAVRTWSIARRTLAAMLSIGSNRRDIAGIVHLDGPGRVNAIFVEV